MQTIHVSGQSPSSQIVSDDRVGVEFGEAPVRFFHHGWQSWSLAAWVDARRPLPVPHPHILHPMHIDPLWAFHPRLHSSWVGAAMMQDGHVVLLGSLGLDAHVELDGGTLSGWYEAGSGPWFVCTGDETSVFAAYAQELRTHLGRGTHRQIGGVWCSWYSLYSDIEEQLLARVLDGLAGLPFEVVQVDDGWQQAIGDWEPNEKFPSGMQVLAERIKGTGRRAGLWLAPLIAVKSSRLFRAHRGWFLRDAASKLVSAGFNWGEPLYALDTTHAEVLEWLAALMRQVRSWGFDYLKLDFLYGGALPGVRHANMPRETALRQGLQALREGMGADALFLGCGAPILPSLGVCDALRVGPDVWSDWESERDEMLLHNPAIPGGRTALRTAANRLWLAPLIIPDPDVVYFRSVECSLTDEEKTLLQGLALVCGFRATSDPPQWLSPEERQQLGEFFRRAPVIERLGPRRFRLDGTEIDFGPASELRSYSGVWNGVQSTALGWLANHEWALKIDYWMRRRAARQRISRFRASL